MKKHASKGFTLLELLVTVAVAAAVFGIAAPNFTRFAKNNRLTGDANDLLAGLYAARAEAIKQQLPTTMCFTTDPTTSAPTCNGTGKEGWIVWVDLNANASVESDEVLVRHGPMSATTTLDRTPSNGTLVSYGANGFSRGIANTLQGIVLCDDRKNKVLAGTTSTARGVLIESTGRPSVNKTYNTIKTSASLLNNDSSKACYG